jgi:hypothetical protein
VRKFFNKIIVFVDNSQRGLAIILF